MTYLEVYGMMKQASMQKSAETIRQRMLRQKEDRRRKQQEHYTKQNRWTFNQANTDALNTTNIKDHGLPVSMYQDNIFPSMAKYDRFKQFPWFKNTVAKMIPGSGNFGYDVAGWARKVARPQMLQSIYQNLPADVDASQMPAIKDFVDKAGQRNLKIQLNNYQNSLDKNRATIDPHEIPFPSTNEIKDPRVRSIMNTLAPHITQNTLKQPNKYKFS